MLIALDYDLTYTLDPVMWDEFVRYAKTRGHRFVCVTGRDVPPDFNRERKIDMPIVCAPGEAKFRAAMRAGYAVDVWIDDAPGTIPATGRLQWDES
jgi:hypothetical protein